MDGSADRYPRIEDEFSNAVLAVHEFKKSGFTDRRCLRCDSPFEFQFEEAREFVRCTKCEFFEVFKPLFS